MRCQLRVGPCRRSGIYSRADSSAGWGRLALTRRSPAEASLFSTVGPGPDVLRSSDPSGSRSSSFKVHDCPGNGILHRQFPSMSGSELCTARDGQRTARPIAIHTFVFHIETSGRVSAVLARTGKLGVIVQFRGFTLTP